MSRQTQPPGRAANDTHREARPQPTAGRQSRPYPQGTRARHLRPALASDNRADAQPPPARARSPPPPAPRTTTASDHPTMAPAADPPPPPPPATAQCRTELDRGL